MLGDLRSGDLRTTSPGHRAATTLALGTRETPVDLLDATVRAGQLTTGSITLRRPRDLTKAAPQVVEVFRADAIRVTFAARRVGCASTDDQSARLRPLRALPILQRERSCRVGSRTSRCTTPATTRRRVCSRASSPCDDAVSRRAGAVDGEADAALACAAPARRRASRGGRAWCALEGLSVGEASGRKPRPPICG